MPYFLPYNTTTIAYEKIGTGKTVVLLHGFGEDYTVWQNVTEALQNDYCLIIPHLAGTGQSAEAAAYSTIADNVAILHQILQKENIDKIVLLGHSMGGYIALAYAAKYENTLLGLGLLHSTAIADTNEKKIARQKNIDFITTHGSALFLEQTTPNLFAPTYVATSKLWLTQYIASLTYMKSNVLISYTKAMMDRKAYTDWLSSTTLPILFVMGELDNAVPLAIGLQQCHLPKVSYIHILKNVGHMGMWEAPSMFNEAVGNFLKDIK